MKDDGIRGYIIGLFLGAALALPIGFAAESHVIDWSETPTEVSSTVEVREGK